MILSLHPGVTFSQVQGFASLLYAKVSQEERNKLRHLLRDGCEPTFGDFITLQKQDPRTRKTVLFNEIECLFYSCKELQKKWLSGEAVIKAINRISKYPSSPAFNMFGLRRPFESQELFGALKVGHGGETGIGMHSIDIGAASPKTFFFQKAKVNNVTRYYLYVDLSTDSKVVPNVLPEQAEEVVCQFELKDVLPVEVYELINPWYAREYEKVFEPRDDETVREAVKNQMSLLRTAANDEKKMRELVDDLEESLDEYAKGILLDDGKGWAR
jgi:hypothetical protein